MSEFTRGFNNIETGIEWKPFTESYKPEWDLPVEDADKFEEIKQEIEEKSFGRWGNARKNYLLENNPGKLVSLAKEMDIEKYLMELNEKADNKLSEMEEEMKKKNPDPNDWLKTAQYYTKVRKDCEEMINSSMIYPEEEETV